MADPPNCRTESRECNSFFSKAIGWTNPTGGSKKNIKKGYIVAKKGKRPRFALVCEDCKKNGKTRRNYVTVRSVVNTPEKMSINKFCSVCKKRTLHKEAKLPNPKKQ